MGILLDKIKEMFESERLISDKIAKIAKLKKLSDNEKFDKMLDTIGEYVASGSFKRRNTYVTYEEYYERFYINGVKNPNLYEKYYKIIEENEKFMIVDELKHEIDEVLKLNLEKESSRVNLILETFKAINDKAIKKSDGYNVIFSLIQDIYDEKHEIKKQEDISSL